MLSLSNHSNTLQLRQQWLLPCLLTACFIAFIIALMTGGVTITLTELIAAASNSTNLDLKYAILWEIRLPRVILAMIVGAGLAICGAAMQAIFRNPLADPGLIGVSSGAALGAVSTIVLGSTIFSAFTASFTIYAVPIGAFIGCVTVCLFIYRLSALNGQLTVISLLLAGIAVNAIVSAVIGILTLVSTDQQLRDLTFWSMGSLAGNHFSMMLPSLIIIVLSSAYLLRLAHPLNLYLLGEEQAKHVGINVNTLKKKVFICTALCTGSAVAITGVIGFVGFIIPHIMRLIIGPDHRHLLPSSIVAGALFLSLADLLARTVILPAELPIGLITSAIGGPFFLFILLKTYRLRR